MDENDLLRSIAAVLASADRPEFTVQFDGRDLLIIVGERVYVLKLRPARL